MKNIKTICLTILCAGALISSCKKKDDTTATPAAPKAPVVDTLCVGNGQNQYYPIALNDTWISFEGGIQISETLTVTGTTAMNSQTYFVFAGSDVSTWTEYHRIASNGDVYFNNGADYLEVPANPVLNSEWYIGGDSLKVTSLSTTVTTSACTYTNCLAIAELDYTGSLQWTYYYKKGVGPIRQAYGLFFGNTDLTSVHLH